MGSGILMGGTLRFEDVRLSGNGVISIIDAADVSITRGDLYAQGGLKISGSSVSFKDISVDLNPSPLEISTSNVSFERTFISIRMTEMYIDDSIVSLNRSSISSMYHCPQIKNSTLTFSDSSAGCSYPEEPWSIRHSVLKLTQSHLSLFNEEAGSIGLVIADSLVNATCNGRDDIIASNGGDATVTNSTMHFANCSCQMSRGITATDSLSVTGGSTTYGKCEKRASKTLPASMLV
jgi:hypothetical protein